MLERTAVCWRAGIHGARALMYVDVHSMSDDCGYIQRYVSQMQNVSGHVNQDCIAANPGKDEWKCFMAEYTAPHIHTRFFALQSAYDAWQMANVVALPCGMPHCNATEKVRTFIFGLA